MNHFRFIVPCVVILSTSVYAQQIPPTTSPGKTTKAPAQKEVDPEILQRRSIAMSLLQSLAIEARSYRDEPLRARVQARVADALWDQDKETARSLFRRAWEVAEAVETDAPNPGNSGPGRLAASRPARPRTNLRREIVQLAARRDHALGEEFLAKLTAKEAAGRTNDRTSDRPELSTAEIAERLRLAGGFLEADNVERALQFADPALTSGQHWDDPVFGGVACEERYRRRSTFRGAAGTRCRRSNVRCKHSFAAHVVCFHTFDIPGCFADWLSVQQLLSSASRA